MDEDEPDFTVPFVISAPAMTITRSRSGKWERTSSGFDASANTSDGGGVHTNTFEAALYEHRATYKCEDKDFPEDNDHVSYACSLSGLPETIQPGESFQVSIRADAESFDELIRSIYCGFWLMDGYLDQEFLPIQLTSVFCWPSDWFYSTSKQPRKRKEKPSVFDSSW